MRQKGVWAEDLFAGKPAPTRAGLPANGPQKPTQITASNRCV
ncbi:hypothetical protein PRJ_0630 [Pseudomonas sp. XWY-1]|nr:hypothetical protein PRJ_0630 [Pseudomonas sp. XWY-1]